MGVNFELWQARTDQVPYNFDELVELIYNNRNFKPTHNLYYGDHGIDEAAARIVDAIKSQKRIALYGDYDVDGVMSCVSWVWFFNEVSFTNFTYYIPSRFSEGYGVNLNAVKYLIDDQKAEVIITMDSGITAKSEADYCADHGVEFICTDHHTLQEEKTPSGIVVNPKLHPDPEYQELCGCGITFVLLRKVGESFDISSKVWSDILALAGVATICDVVPLNGVNHKLAKMGISSLVKSDRKILKQLLLSSSLQDKVTARDVGFRIGPRINAVGRMEHAMQVVDAFVSDEVSADAFKFMDQCNEKRKNIQTKIFKEALDLAEQYRDDPIIFIGQEGWHHGVLGIVASKLCERLWKPVLLFAKEEGVCKGSARAMGEFDLSKAMSTCKDLFIKFGGHKSAGGFSLEPEDEDKIRSTLIDYANSIKQQNPTIWQSTIYYDCELPLEIIGLELLGTFSSIEPFGHGFEEPVFRTTTTLRNIIFYKDKKTLKPKHTAIFVGDNSHQNKKIIFFDRVFDDLSIGSDIQVLFTVGEDTYQGVRQVTLYGVDLETVS